MATGVAVQSRLGRPRKRPAAAGSQPREDILNAAADLFETYGFSATTTRQIAAAVGLEQASMFHYFRRKDDLLAELLDRTLEPALAYAGWLDRQSMPADWRLYLLAYRDTYNICSGRQNLARLMRLPEARRPEFAAYWRKRLGLKRRYGRYVAAGLRDGMFAGVSAALGTELVFAMVESSIDWFARGRDKPVDAAADVARSVVRLMLADPRHLDSVIAAASALVEAGPGMRADTARARR
jgi:AcrR family transcriptional regulator